MKFYWNETFVVGLKTTFEMTDAYKKKERERDSAAVLFSIHSSIFKRGLGLLCSLRKSVGTRISHHLLLQPFSLRFERQTF